MKATNSAVEAEPFVALVNVWIGVRRWEGNGREPCWANKERSAPEFSKPTQKSLCLLSELGVMIPYPTSSLLSAVWPPPALRPQVWMFVAKVLGEDSTRKQPKWFLGNVLRGSQQAPPSVDFHSTQKK